MLTFIDQLSITFKEETMKEKSIKVGCWYETKVGIDVCLKVGGRFPPAVEFHIVAPFPRAERCH